MPSGRLLFLFVLVLLAIRGQAQPAADLVRLRQHVRWLTSTPQSRNYRQVAVLDTVAQYIARQLRAAGARVSTQPYEAEGRT